MRTWRYFLLVAAGALVTVGFVACTIVDGLELPSSDGGVNGDAGSDANTVPDAGPCRRPGYPDPPVNFATGDSIEFRVAVDSMDFGVIDGGPSAPVGYNLDNECTCYGQPPDPQSCVSTSPSQKHCDDLGSGIDNSLGELINGPARTDGLDVRGLAMKQILNGQNGLLIRVSQYNGMPDDSSVTISFYESGGPVLVDGDGGMKSVPPTFTASDVWTVDDKSLIPNVAPSQYSAVTTTPGYVTGNILVATSLDATVRLDVNVVIALTGGAVTGTIVKQADGYHLQNAYFVGRWPTADALRNIATLSPPNSDGGHVCDVQDDFIALKSIICASADISTTGPDNGSRPCDAISVGIHFSAVPATFGPVVDLDPGTQPCEEAEAGADDCSQL